VCAFVFDCFVSMMRSHQPVRFDETWCQDLRDRKFTRDTLGRRGRLGGSFSRKCQSVPRSFRTITFLFFPKISVVIFVVTSTTTTTMPRQTENGGTMRALSYQSRINERDGDVESSLYFNESDEDEITFQSAADYAATHYPTSAEETTQYDDETTKYNDESTRHDDQTTRYDDQTCRFDDETTRFDDGSTGYDSERLTRHDDETTRNDDQFTGYDEETTRFDDETTRFDDRSSMYDYETTTTSYYERRRYNEGETSCSGQSTRFGDESTYDDLTTRYDDYSPRNDLYYDEETTRYDDHESSSGEEDDRAYQHSRESNHATRVPMPPGNDEGPPIPNDDDDDDSTDDPFGHPLEDPHYHARRPPATRPGAVAVVRRGYEQRDLDGDEEWDPTAPTPSHDMEEAASRNGSHNRTYIDATITPMRKEWCGMSTSKMLLYGGILVLVTGAACVSTGIAVVRKNIRPAAPSPTDICNFTDSAKPDAIVQCGCNGNMTGLPEAVLSSYEELKQSFIPTLFPGGFDYPTDSCEPQNAALLWLATDEQARSPESMRNRYLLSLLYTSWQGLGWENKAGWLSSDSECTWYGINCTNTLVSEINLFENRLSGELVTELGLFQDLRK